MFALASERLHHMHIALSDWLHALLSLSLLPNVACIQGHKARTSKILHFQVSPLLYYQNKTLLVSDLITSQRSCSNLTGTKPESTSHFACQAIAV